MTNVRHHPVWKLVRDASYFAALPTDDDLDRLDLPAGLRQALVDACTHAAELHDAGSHQDAWQRGDEAAARLIGQLPEEQRDPAYYADDRDPLAGIDDPRELAEAVLRHGGGIC